MVLGVVQNDPTGQSDSITLPAGQWLPNAHGVPSSDVLPVPGQYVPAEHGKHPSPLIAPSSELKVPGGHGSLLAGFAQ